MSNHRTTPATVTSVPPLDNSDADARALQVRELAVELETMTVLVENLVETSVRCTTAEEFEHWRTSATHAVAKIGRLARWSTKIAGRTPQWRAPLG